MAFKFNPLTGMLDISSAGGGGGAFLPLAGGTMTGPLLLSGNATQALEAVTFQQLNAFMFGQPLGSAHAASTAIDGNIALSGQPTLDGQLVPLGQIAHLQFQTDPRENGPWVTAAGAWSRPSNFSNGTNADGAYIAIVNGPTYGGQLRQQINNPCVVGTDNQTWDFLSDTIYLAGAGLALVGNTFSIANGGIVDSMVNAAAAIQGTKISPDFGTQFVSSLGGASFQTLEVIDNGPDTGWLAMPFVTAASVATSASVTKFFADALNSFSFKGDGFFAKFEMGSFSANRTFTLPNIDGVLAVLPINLTTDVTGILPIANGGTNNSSLDPNAVLFTNGAGSQVISDVTSLAFDGTNLGVGNDTTPMRLTVGGGANPSSYANRDVQGAFISGGNIGISKLIVENTFGSGLGSEIALSSRPGAAMGAFEDLGQVSFFGQDNASNQRRGAYIRGITSGAWTSTSLPTHMDFFTTASGSTSPTQRARLHSSGEMYFGATSLVGNVGTLNIGPLASNKIGLYIRGQSGQTADLLQVQNNSAVTLMNVEADGDLNARSLKAAGSSGTGFLELNNQFIGILAPSSAIRVYSNGGNLAVKTASPTYTFDHSLLSTNRTFQFQDSDYIIANVPSAGVVVSNGTTLSSFYRELAKVTVAVPSNTGTFVSLAELTTSSLAAGTYRFKARIVYTTNATTSGIGMRLVNTTATVSNLVGNWIIPSSATASVVYPQLNATTNPGTTSSPPSTTNILAIGEGIFTITSAGTMSVQFRSETAGLTATIQPQSFLEIEQI